MREIFTSGSRRGEWVAPLAESPSLPLYRLFLNPCVEERNGRNGVREHVKKLNLDPLSTV